MPKPSKPQLSHFTASGHATMVDVSAKPSTRRTATASAFVELSETVLAALPANPKGSPLEVARFAGIQAAKRTADLIPMCHPLPLTHIDVQAEARPRRRPHHRNRSHHRPHRRRDGSPDSRLRRRPYRLRHDQSPRQIHRHPHPPARIKNPAARAAISSDSSDRGTSSERTSATAPKCTTILLPPEGAPMPRPTILSACLTLAALVRNRSQRPVRLRPSNHA